MLLLLKNKKVRKVLIGIGIGIIMFFLLICLSDELVSYQASTTLANTAESEYEYWQGASPTSKGFTCQGQKYCKSMGQGIVDWCAIFCGYCIKESGYKLDEFGYNAYVPTWISNLKAKNKLGIAGEYTPQPGNLIFFDYAGRSHFKATYHPAHIGIVTEVNEDEITIVAGNEYNGQTSNWASVSEVHRYKRKISDNSICAYGKVGSEDIVSFNLNIKNSSFVSLTRNVITKNEIGVEYDNIEPSKYGYVLPDDNGALSIGVMQWHSNNARAILQLAYRINKTEIRSVCKSYGSTGRYILDCIKNSSSWTRFIPNGRQSNCIKALLLTKSGRQAQDKTSLSDVNEFIEICQKHKITDKKVIIYCSDILNQWGTGSFNANVYGSRPGTLHNVNGSMTLTQVYNSRAGWGSRSQYKARRTRTYEYLKNTKIKG